VKLCRVCGVAKPLEDFYSNGRTSTGNFKYKPDCKLCFNKAVAVTTAKKLDFVKSVFGVSCQVCGYDRCYSALEFHHVDPSTKENPPSVILRNSATLEKVVKELSGCVQLCANCHREVHYGFLDITNLELKMEKFSTRV